MTILERNWKEFNEAKQSRYHDYVQIKEHDWEHIQFARCIVCGKIREVEGYEFE